MASEEQLIVRMDGPSGDGGAILGRHFMSVLSNALALLKQADKEQTVGKKGPKSDFFVVNMSRSSPCKMEIACRLANGGRPLFPGPSPVFAVSAAFQAIQNGKADSISAPMMTKVEQFIAPRREKASHRLELLNLDFVNGRAPAPPVPIDMSFLHQVDRARAHEFTCRTVVSGPAKMLDLRKEEKEGEIKIKIMRPEGEVTCILGKHLHKQAINALNKVAVIRGLGRYRPNDFYPYQIKVTNDDDIDIIHPDSGAPKLSELEGAFPGLTGGKSVAEYLREIRGDE